MDFDKKTIAAFVLIGLILIFIQTDFYQRHLVPGTKQDKELVPDSPIPPDTPDAADQRSVVSSLTPEPFQFRRPTQEATTPVVPTPVSPDLDLHQACRSCLSPQ